VRLTSDDQFAADLRGFGAIGVLATLAILLGGNLTFGPMITVPLGGLLALLWTWRSRTPWYAVGYVRPRNWLLSIAIGITLGVAFKLLMKTIIMPFLGASPVNPAYHALAGNNALLPGAIWTMLMAGFGEETVFRGFLFERGSKLVRSKGVIVVVTASLFALAHTFDQGKDGAEQAAITGLVFGTIFARTGQIFTLMFAHTAFDLTAVAIIYCDIEARLGHLVFK